MECDFANVGMIPQPEKTPLMRSIYLNIFHHQDKYKFILYNIKITGIVGLNPTLGRNVISTCVGLSPTEDPKGLMNINTYIILLVSKRMTNRV
jgi:hypothetical protein